MRTSDFDYLLPRELIAQTPLEPRDHSRLMAFDRETGQIAHHRFYELPQLLRPDDLLVFNDTRVLPARLYGKRADTGGKVELLLVRREGPGLWQCLGKPGRRLHTGTSVEFGGGLTAHVLERSEGGLFLAELNDESLVNGAGDMPLPPYIHEKLNDPERYQTVYAGQDAGSVAAPTAGLHFTPELMKRLRDAGHKFAFVTLHVGLDTFRPVDEQDPNDHKLHTESWELPGDAALSINRAREEGRRIIAVGTTTVRLLEQAALLGEQEGGRQLRPYAGWADLFILPGHRFRLVDVMLTNFHLPRSSLLMLVSAFAGRERILNAYRTAMQEGYRFYSFGDAMLIS